MSSITVVLLAYKEEENLKILLPEIIKNLKKTKQKYNILVVDTEKPLDNTKDVCRKYNARYINQEYPKFAGAFKTAIKYADNDLFLITDSDGSHNPKYIPDIYKKYVTEKCDVVIGSRYVKGGKTNDSKSSIIMSKILNAFFRTFLGIKAHDISTDYRLYNTKMLKKIELKNENYDVLQEVLLKLKLNNNNKLKIGEVPITFEKRIYGESKRKLIPFIISYIKSLFRLTILRISFFIKNKILDKKLLKQIFKFCVVGGTAFIIDYGLLYILTEMFNINYLISGAISFVVSLIYNYILSIKWVFNVGHKQTVKDITLFSILSTIGLGINELIMYVGSDKIGINYLIVKIIATAIVMIYNFITRKIFIEKK